MLAIVGANMANAIRSRTVQKGIDPREFALVAFGGAGPLHAAAVADELGMSRVVVPAASGVLSALGLVVSERRRDLVESVLLSGAALTRERVAATVGRLGEQGRRELGEPGAELRASYELRYAGQAFELPVAAGLAPDPAELRRSFDRAHSERYGYADPDAELELVTVRVTAARPGAEPRPAEPRAAEPRGTRPMRFGDEQLEGRVVGPGVGSTDGPAVVELPGSTLVVPPGWRAEAGAEAVLMERTRGRPR